MDEEGRPGTYAEQEMAKSFAAERRLERAAMARWPAEDAAYVRQQAFQEMRSQAELDPISEGSYISCMDSLYDG